MHHKFVSKCVNISCTIENTQEIFFFDAYCQNSVEVYAQPCEELIFPEIPTAEHPN